MKRIFSVLTIVCLVLILQGCNYYLCESSSELPLYSDTYSTSIVYKVPMGERVLVKKKKGHYCYVQYKDILGWTTWDRLHYLDDYTVKRYKLYYNSPNFSSNINTSKSNVNSRPKDVYVRGYYRTSKSGKTTYVHPYYRSSPSSRSSSGSYKGGGRRH